MPANAPTRRATNAQTLIEFLRFNQNAFFAVAYGLTDEQARSTPSVSTLSIGGLIKHAAGVQRGWMQRVEAGAGVPAARRAAVRRNSVAEYEDEYVMRDDETLERAARHAAEPRTSETLRIFADGRSRHAGAGAPRCAVVSLRTSTSGNVRWVALHLIEELARHAGHGDIIRESIDGATMYELMAGIEGWPETDWIKPLEAASRG